MNKNKNSLTQNKDIRKFLYNQIKEAYGKIVYNYEIQITEATDQKSLNDRLKWTQLILSAITAGGCLGVIINQNMILAWISAISSILVFAITAYFKDNTFSERYKNYKQAADDFWELREDYLLLLVEFDQLTTKEVEDRIEELKNKASKVFKEAPITNNRSNKKVHKKLKNENFDILSKEDINKMLPKELRGKY